MKIILEVPLTNGNLALELDSMRQEDFNVFEQWADDSQITKYVKLTNCYRSDAFGDISFMAIDVNKDSPPGIKELCLLRWI
jgi:hypothetical protein